MTAINMLALGREVRSGVRISTLPLFYWVATLTCRLLTLPPQSSQLQETAGLQKGSIRTGPI